MTIGYLCPFLLISAASMNEAELVLVPEFWWAEIAFTFSLADFQSVSASAADSDTCQST